MTILPEVLKADDIGSILTSLS